MTVVNYINFGLGVSELFRKTVNNPINLKLQGPRKLHSLTHFKVANIFVQGTVGHEAAEGKQLLPIKHDFE